LSFLKNCKPIFSFALLPFYTLSQSRIETAEVERRPRTIPALKQWLDGAGNYTFDASSRIVFSADDAPQLTEAAEIFADDLLMFTGIIISTVSDTSLHTGDILLKLDSIIAISNDEGYILEVGDCLTISARTEHGVFNGTRTVLQLLKQSLSISGGIAHDWPDYAQRSLMVDMGRKYFSVAWLEKHIRELAFLKYNYFHFHLSDNYGFRLECESHPEIVSSQYYTKAEIRSLIELARKYHITIVPEIDMPGHMDAILESHPELRLTGSSGSTNYECLGDIDLANPVSYRFMQDLLDEFIPLFPGPYWHIGADEYLYKDGYEPFPQLLQYAREHFGPDATAKDCYLAFVNWANEIVKSHGKITRVWNDGLYGGQAVSVARDMVYEHWYHEGITPQEILDLGLYLVNSSIAHLYYVLGRGYRASSDLIYDAFELHIFHNQAVIDPLNPLNLGAKLHVWCDVPDAETEEQVAEGITYPLRSLAQKNWGSPKLVLDHERFVEICDELGRAPGY
jgi:hexosaminidase